MTPNSDLHLLVRSLSPHEQRYFRMTARIQTSQDEWNYMRLFDAILEQDEYDEEAIKKQFKGTKIAANLSVEKHYLYMQLLSSLRKFRASKQKNLELSDMLDGVEILASKGLDLAAMRLLMRAKKLAARLQIPLLQAKVHFLERRIGKRAGKKKKQSGSEKLAKESLDLQKLILQEFELHKLYDEFSELIMESYTIRNEEREKALTQLLNRPILNEQNSADSLQSLSLGLQIKGTTAILRREFETAYENYCEILSIWENNDHLIARFPVRYLSILGNHLSGLDLTRRSDQMPLFIEKIRMMGRKLGRKTSAEDRRIFHFQLRYYLVTGDLAQAIVAANELETFLLQFEEKLTSSWKLASAYNLSTLYFVTGKFPKALRWTNYIINMKASIQRKSLQHIARVFQLILHYELGNSDVLEYLIRNSRAYLKREGAMYRLETVIVKTVGQLIKLTDQSEKKECLQSLEKVLLETPRKGLYGVNEILIWVKSRLTGKDIMAVAGQMQTMGKETTKSF